MPSKQSTPRRWKLVEAIALLEKMYGHPGRPRVTDPFEMAVRENAAYLVDDTRREEIFERLRNRVGLTPEAILAAPGAVLADTIADGGMRPADRAAKLKHCAEIAHEIGVARLRATVRSDPAAARKLVKRFPGFGEPGADKVLLYNGTAATLAPDSNALRVLVRLGFGRVGKSYAQTYSSAAEAVAPELSAEFPWLVAARGLLRRHGQELCRRTTPSCEVCPLSSRCAAFRAESFPAI